MNAIPLAMVVPAEGARPLVAAVVDALTDSIDRIGLLQPVIVQETKLMRGGVFTAGYRLVAGHHRVEACRRLGWQTIDAIELGDEVSFLEKELIEIDENLCRAELTPAQRAVAIKRRKEIWEALHPHGVSAQIAPKPQGGRPTEFSSETAAVSGESKSQINRHLSRAEALGEDLLKVAGTSLDKGVELDALKSLPAEQRAPLIERAQAGEQVSARKPAARISLTIEYFTVEDGAVAIASQLIRRDRWLAAALLDELNNQLGKT
jgi:hypothetical protein